MLNELDACLTSIIPPMPFLIKFEVPSILNNYALFAWPIFQIIHTKINKSMHSFQVMLQPRWSILCQNTWHSRRLFHHPQLYTRQLLFQFLQASMAGQRYIDQILLENKFNNTRPYFMTPLFISSQFNTTDSFTHIPFSFHIQMIHHKILLCKWHSNPHIIYVHLILLFDPLQHLM